MIHYRGRCGRTGPFRRVLPILFAVGAAAFLAVGCDSKQEGGGDLGPGGGGATADDPDAEAIRSQALSALQFVNAFVEDIDAYRTGDFSGLGEDLGMPTGTSLRSANEPTWSAELGAWVLDAAGSETEEGATVTYDIFFQLQFVDAGGTPQQEPDASTAAFAVGLDMSMGLHAEEDGEVFDLQMDVAMDMGMSGLPDGPYALTGSGGMDFSILWTGLGEDDIDATAAMDWNMNLALAGAEACPVGSVEVTADALRVTAQYDGDATYAYQVSENGVTVESGTDALNCGPAS